jgi:uncharacterized protein YcbK (DUF882 family)
MIGHVKLQNADKWWRIEYRLLAEGIQIERPKAVIDHVAGAAVDVDLEGVQKSGLANNTGRVMWK